VRGSRTCTGSSVEDLQAPDLDVGLLDVDPVVGQALFAAEPETAQEQADGDEVSVDEAFRHVPHGVWHGRSHGANEIDHGHRRHDVIGAEHEARAGADVFDDGRGDPRPVGLEADDASVKADLSSTGANLGATNSTASRGRAWVEESLDQGGLLVSLGEVGAPAAHPAASESFSAARSRAP